MSLLVQTRPPAGGTAPLAAPPPLISLRGIERSFARGETEVLALRGVDLDIRRGEFVAIMGQSGSGKTTLMNILGLLDRPSGGSYRFDDEEVGDLDPTERAGLRRDRFGFVFQQYNLLANESALENVEVPAVYAGKPKALREERAAELLTMLGLGERLDHRPAQLSGGQQQRVSIARALMNGGEVILADEPTGALDSASGQDVMRLLRELHGLGHTVILITHDRGVAQQADRLVEMRDGRIIADSGAVLPAPRTRSGTPAPARASAMPVAGEILKTAGRALSANLFRTALTLLGVVIGVASVVAMLAIGNGAKKEVLDRISAMGPDLLLVRPGARNVRTTDGTVATLVDADRLAIERLENVRGAISEYTFNATARAEGADAVTQTDSTVPSFPDVRAWPVASGSFFTERDVKEFAAVAVIGQTVARNLFGEADPLGAYMLLNNVPFQVIGVMAAKGATPFGSDQDDVVFVPLTTGQLRLHGKPFVRSITVQVADTSRMDETEAELTALLQARHGAMDFQIRNTAAILDMAMESQNTLTVLLGAIALISLLVGGIGVMNIMLVSVTERTREIGVRMATGARPRDILLQFNAEALAVCLVGGLVGVLLGVGSALALGAFGRPILLTTGPILLAFACAVLTGLIFGYLPARKASRLDPVAALAAD
ncbi:MAG TPA: MacB family efflux pump subunit [Geminicoccus sp.]|uniref:MacB family efflux pump subunit n=1 Tax=Geminicoccus sp. TaxID=2024832 RepID=UPI002E2EB1B4|nr:MacB family efflux pump subunit [Geminicoccus sp.]HEX2529515.1 MacB family efflux pump subunit [Geminicoccus sp.]